MKPIYETDDAGIYLKVHVQPGAANTAFAGIHNERLKVRLSAKAVDGAANECLRVFLSQSLGVSKSSVTLVQGEKSREKRLFISGSAKFLGSAIDAILARSTD